MIYEVYHKTEYRYSEPVTSSQHTIHLQPRSMDYQKIHHCLLDINPKPNNYLERVDYFGNRSLFFSLEEPHLRLQITVRSRVEVLPRSAPSLTQASPREEALTLLSDDATPAGLHIQEFLHPSPFAPHCEDLRLYAQTSFQKNRSLLEGAWDLNHRIFEDFEFDPAATTVSTPVSEVFQQRRGVCQDFAHLMIACLRSLGLAARYVSGYVRTQPAPGKPRLFGADASHAWVSVFCPGQGWVDLDPTNDRLVDQDYVTLGWGRDYGDVSLIRGVLSGGGQHSLYFSVNMQAEAEAAS
jgi:transglutaminase-like putative cysteine protease